MNEIDQKKLSSLVTQVKNKIHTLSKHNITIIFGPMGSGKSTFIKNNLMDPKKVHVSIDNYISDIYSEEYTVTDMYKRARKIGTAFTDILLEMGISMIIEGTGINDDMFEYIDRLKAVGYHVTIYIINTPLDVCISRVKDRNRVTSRKISIEAIINAHTKLEKNKEKFRNVSDKFIIVSTTNGYEYNTGALNNIKIKLDANFVLNEKSLHCSSIEFAKQNGGYVTNTLIDEILKLVDLNKYDIMINTKKYKLVKHCTPKNPIWKMAGFNKGENCEKVMIFTLNQPTFNIISNRNIFISIPNQTMNGVNTYINNMEELDVKSVPESNIVAMNSNELIKFNPYEGNTDVINFLFFAYVYNKNSSDVIYLNEIREQVQIYFNIKEF